MIAAAPSPARAAADPRHPPELPNAVGRRHRSASARARNRRSRPACSVSGVVERGGAPGDASVTVTPSVPGRTTWLPQPCRQYCMSEATMQYENAGRAAGGGIGGNRSRQAAQEQQERGEACAARPGPARPRVWPGSGRDEVRSLLVTVVSADALRTGADPRVSAGPRTRPSRHPRPQAPRQEPP